MADAGLRAACDPLELANQLERHRRRRGAGRARRVVSFADKRAESPGESFSRIVLAALDLPVDELQYEVIDPGTGEVLARCDFGWSAWGTVGEFDGRVKYGRLLREGQDPGEVVFAEKQREDRIRDVGLQVVRWTSPDLRTPLMLASRLQRAFARGGR